MVGELERACFNEENRIRILAARYHMRISVIASFPEGVLPGEISQNENQRERRISDVSSEEIVGRPGDVTRKQLATAEPDPLVVLGNDGQLALYDFVGEEIFEKFHRHGLVEVELPGRRRREISTCFRRNA